MIEGGLRLVGKGVKNDNFPIIGIITVVKNGDKFLTKTIQSVISQTYNNIEYIIIDGNSNDNTLNIIQHYSSQIEYWMSEPDDGLYHAMNKGVGFSSADYILFLNADDYLNNNDVIQQIADQIKTVDFDMIYGNIVWMDEIMEYELVLKNRITIKNLKNAIQPSHPAVFFKRIEFNLLNGFNNDYKVAADFDFFCRAIINNVKHLYLDVSVSNFRTNGLSNRNRKLLYNEAAIILKKHFGTFWSLKYLVKSKSKLGFHLIVEKMHLVNLVLKIKKHFKFI